MDIIVDEHIGMEKEQWIFYLKMQKNLPMEYFSLDQRFKEYGKTLIPMEMKSLLDIIKKSPSVHVLIVIRSMDEYKYFRKRIKKIMKLLIRSGKVHLYMVSSFSSGRAIKKI